MAKSETVMVKQNEHELKQRLARVEATLDALQQEKQEKILSRFRSTRLAPFIEAEAKFQKARPTLPHLKRFPATLQDFYRLIVKARDKAENQPRFKRFLRFIYQEIARKQECDSQVEQTFQTYQKHGFSLDIQWDHFAWRYMHWWAKEKTEAKRRGGLARAAKAAAGKKAQQTS